MKITLTEDQIARIRAKIAKNPLNEDLLDDLISKGSNFVNKGIEAGKEFISGLEFPVEKKSEDVPGTADFISENVDDFFNILKSIDTPLTQQKLGTMVHQQGVEAVQIGLQILGYELPRFGTDGLFGPETAAAVKKYKQDKSIINESSIPGIDEMVWNKMPWGIDAGKKQPGIKWANHDTHIHFGFTNAEVAVKVIEKAKELGLHAGENPYSAKVHPVHVDDSHHYKTFNQTINGKKVGGGLDVSGNSQKMAELFNWVSTTLGDGGSVTMDTSYVDGSDSSTMETITPKMAEQMVQDLSSKGVTSDELKKYIDPAVSSGGAVSFTDIDLNTNEGKEAYARICQNYIDSRDPNAQVNGKMLADSAATAFKTYRKYVPPELALAQLTLEGGIGASDTSRPMKTKNPFNVGNTDNPYHDNYQPTFEAGVDLYYSLIARKYLVKGKTASDLVNDFRNGAGNHYAKPGAYEAGLKTLLNSIRRRNASVYAELAQQNTQAISESILLEADKRQAIKNAFRFNDAWADEFHQLSDKLSIWIADTFVKKMVDEYGNQAPEEMDKRRYIINLLNQASPTSRNGLGAFWANDYKSKYEYIMHWIRAPRREQLNIRDLSFDDAYAQAQEWHDSLSYKSESNFKETGDVFIDYRNSDGQGYYWVHLHKNYCADEADRMGHCARSNNGQLISFRRINEFGEGSSLLTVDYRPGGIIGDFHRHGNNKPTARFHPQIIDFLVNTSYPVTQLTRDGVHRYEDNFQLADLTPAQKESVFTRNPALKFNINDPDSIVNIVNAVIDGEININQYRGADLVKLIKKAKSINKSNEFKALINKETVINFYNTPSRDGKDNVAFFSLFSDEINEYLIGKVLEEKARGNGMHMFQDILRNISQNFFEAYQSFCGVIDFGFKEFPDGHAQILGGRAIKRTILSCTDSVEFLQRYVENKPTDKNGYMAVKTEEGLWGLVNKDGENILLPAFHGIVINPRDKSGKTYQVVNANRDMFVVDIESGDVKKLARK
jgi:hypothetical protein